MNRNARSKVYDRLACAAPVVRALNGLTIVVLLLLIGTVGCTGTEPAPPQTESSQVQDEPLLPKTEADRIMQAQIDAANALSKALESRAPDDEIAALNLQFEQAGEAWNVAGLDEQEVDEATQRYQALFDKAIRRLTKASMKGGTEAL